MARNAALAVAAVEAFLGGQPLAPEIIEEGFASVVAPARLELARTSPAIVIDTAHNPQAAQATIDACQEAFAFQPLIGVVAMMADKDTSGVLEIFASAMDQVWSHVPREPHAPCPPRSWRGLQKTSGRPGRCTRPRRCLMRWNSRPCWPTRPGRAPGC